MITIQNKQLIAETKAREYGFDSVKLLREIGDTAVFRGDTNENTMIGMPLFVEVNDDGEAMVIRDPAYLDFENE